MLPEFPIFANTDTFFTFILFLEISLLIPRISDAPPRCLFATTPASVGCRRTAPATTAPAAPWPLPAAPSALLSVGALKRGTGTPAANTCLVQATLHRGLPFLQYRYGRPKRRLRRGGGRTKNRGAWADKLRFRRPRPRSAAEVPSTCKEAVYNWRMGDERERVRPMNPANPGPKPWRKPRSPGLNPICILQTLVQTRRD